MAARYPEIAAFAGTQSAVYIDASPLSRLCVGALKQLLTVAVPTQTVIVLCQPPYAVRLESAVQITSGRNAVDFYLKFIQRNNDTLLGANDDLRFTFSFGIVDQAGVFNDKKVLSTMTLEIRDLTFEIDVSSDKIICQPGSGACTVTNNRDPNFETRVKDDLKLDRDKTVEIEGMLLFSGLENALKPSFSAQANVDLSTLFPGVSFVGPIKTKISASGDSLFITGANGIIFPPEKRCPCAGAGDGIGPIKPGKVVPDPPPGPGQAPGKGPAGKITFGGPTAIDTNDPQVAARVLGLRGPGEGAAGVFLSNKAIGANFSGPYPGFVVESPPDYGTLSWRVTAVCDFSNVTVTPYPAFGRIDIDLDFGLEAFGKLEFNLGKLGRIRITDFEATQDAGAAANHARIAVYWVVGTSGAYLKPVLEDLNIATYDVDLNIGTIIGTCFGGWGAVYGFIFDTIMNKYIDQEIPLRLDDAIRQSMASMIFPLISLQSVRSLDSALALPASPTAFHAGGAEGLLLSIGNR